MCFENTVIGNFIFAERYILLHCIALSDSAEAIIKKLLFFFVFYSWPITYCFILLQPPQWCWNDAHIKQSLLTVLCNIWDGDKNQNILLFLLLFRSLNFTVHLNFSADSSCLVSQKYDLLSVCLLGRTVVECSSFLRKHTDIVNSHGPPAPTLSDLQRYIWKEAISMPGMKTPF